MPICGDPVGRHIGESVVHETACGAGNGPGVGERLFFDLRIPTVPFKLNQDRRHLIPRQPRKVTNWPTYEASLRQRGSLTVWFTGAGRWLAAFGVEHLLVAPQDRNMDD